MCTNPWQSFNIKNATFILPSEIREVNVANNKQAAPERKLRDDCLPEPFIGCHKAPIYFLLANPGFENGIDNCSMLNDATYQTAVSNNLNQNCDVDYPFYYLNPYFQNIKLGGHKWWLPKLKSFVEDLIKCGGDLNKEKVKKELPHKIFALELYGYHSERFNEHFIDKNLPSLQYVICLVKEAIKKDKTIFVLRKKNLWLDLVPELLCYEHCYFAGSSRFIHLTRKNLSPAAIEDAKRHF